MSDVVAYMFEVKGPFSGEWNKHIVLAEECPDDPADVWRDDHDVRNVTPLVRKEDVQERD